MIDALKKIVKKTRTGFNRFYYGGKVRRRCVSYQEPLYINKKTSVTKRTTLGGNVHSNGLTIQGGGNVSIGSNFHCGIECMMITSVHNYEGEALPYDTTYIHKDISVGDNVWLGSRVMVLGGATIGEGAIIQAGSVVVNDIPPCAIAGGHPAKVFKMRDEEHYNKLKSEGKFQQYGKALKEQRKKEGKSS